MQKVESKGDKPDLKGRIDIAAWYNTDKNGKTYLSIVIGNRAVLYPAEKKIEGTEIENIFD